MKVLGIDTSAGVAAVAVTDGGALRANFTLDSGHTHSTTLLPMIEAALTSLGLTPRDVDLYSVSAGPGSFTGVRIGVATVKGLAAPRGVPCVGVSSLAAMAENFSAFRGIVCPVIDARNSRVFTATFRVDGEEPPERLTNDDVLTFEELDEALSEFKNEKIFITGDASELARESLKRIAPENVPVLLSRQSAAGVAALGERVFRQATGAERETMTPEALSVEYLRKPQAEREREARETGKNE